MFDFNVDPVVIKYFGVFKCICNYQIYNLAETKLNKIFGRTDELCSLVRTVLYKVNLTNDMGCILSFTVAI